MKTNTTPLLLTTLSLCTTLLALPVSAQDAKPKKKPAAEKPAPAKKPAAKEDAPGTKEEKPAAAEGETPALTKEQAVLKEALDNHSRLLGYHVDVLLKTPGGSATITGTLGQGALSLNCTDVKGVKKTRVVVDREFYLSDDDGKSWKKGEDADKQSTLLFNNIITAPVAMRETIVKEPVFTAKEEKLGGEDVLHIEKPAKGKESAIHFWICKEPEIQNMVFIRKAQIVVSGDDLDILATITYSKLTEKVTITAPEVK